MMGSVQSMLLVLSSSLFLQSGCDGVFGLQHIYGDDEEDVSPDAQLASGSDAPASCTIDRFDGGSTGVVWIPEHAPPASEVVFESGKLSVKINPTKQENALAWTNRAYDLTGAATTVRVDKVIGDGDAETYFELERDAENYYFISYMNRQLVMAMGKNDVDQQIKSIAFDPVQHRYWRMQHVIARKAIVFSTSDDGIAFTERHAITVVVPIDAVFIDLGGVIYSGTVTEAVSTYDDFELCLGNQL